MACTVANSGCEVRVAGVMRTLPRTVAVLAWILAVGSAGAETLTIRRHAVEDETTLVGVEHWELERMTTSECTTSRYVAKLGSRVSVSVRLSALEPSRHRGNPGWDTVIDGREVLGTDGIESDEQGRIKSLSRTTYVSDVSVRFGRTTRRIPSRHFVYLISPHHQLDPDGHPRACVGEAFWSPHKQLAIVALSGADGAGSYTVYMLFHRAGYRGRFNGWAGIFGADEVASSFGFGPSTTPLVIDLAPSSE